MKIIKRDQLIAEELIRDHVRKRIRVNFKTQKILETKLRSVVRQLLAEAETGTEEPSVYTGINVLADLLKNIIPNIEDDYKMLTTSSEQRDSFRNHMIHAIKNTLKPIEVSTEAENIPENMEFEIDESILLEKLSVDLDPENDMDAETVEGEFIDIEDDADEDEFVTIDDQNETGRNFAAESFKRVEKQVVDAYDMLADEEDQKLFYDYLITNLLLYFDKFEDELQNELPDVTTPEYEKEKEESESEEVEAGEEGEEATSEEELAI